MEDFATALTQMAVFISFIFSFLKTNDRVVHPSPQTSMQIKRNPTSQQSPADSQQYKTTTTKHQSIHQLLKKIKTEKSQPTGRLLSFLFVLGRVRSSVRVQRGHVIRRCHKATTVQGCLSLQGSTPLLSW